jgi:hypothetical protein
MAVLVAKPLGNDPLSELPLRHPYREPRQALGRLKECSHLLFLRLHWNRIGGGF